MAGRPLKALYENRSITFDPQTSVSTTTITVTNNNLSVDDIVVYKVPTGGTSITNLVNGGVYYVVAKPTAGSFSISSTKSGTAINMGTFGSAGQTHTFTTGFSGVKEMTDNEILGWFTPTVLSMLLGDVGALYGVVGDHAFYLNMALGSASPITNETIRTYWYEKHRSSTVGTHPYGSDDDRLYKLIQKEANYGAGVALTTNTRYYKPVTYSYDSGTGTTQITAMTSQQLYDSLIRVTVNSVITGGRSSYFVGQSAPGTGTWVEVTSFDDRYWASGGALTTTTFKLWRRTDSNIAVTNVRPLVTGVTAVSTNPGDLFEMTESLITGDEYSGLGYHYLVSEYIRTTGIGKYQFSITTPTDPGTWLARGQFVDNVNDVTDQSYGQAFTTNYTTVYTTQYASAYTIAPVYNIVYTGGEPSYATVYTLVYGNPFTKTYSGVALYTGAESGVVYSQSVYAGYTAASVGLFTATGSYTRFGVVYGAGQYTNFFTAGVQYTVLVNQAYGGLIWSLGPGGEGDPNYQAYYTGPAYNIFFGAGAVYTSIYISPFTGGLVAYTGVGQGGGPAIGYAQAAVWVGNVVIGNGVYTNEDPLNNTSYSRYGMGSYADFIFGYNQIGYTGVSGSFIPPGDTSGTAYYTRRSSYTSATNGITSAFTSTAIYTGAYTRTYTPNIAISNYGGQPDIINMFTRVWSNALQTYTGNVFSASFLGPVTYGAGAYTAIALNNSSSWTGSPTTFLAAVYAGYTLLDTRTFASLNYYTNRFTGFYGGPSYTGVDAVSYNIIGNRQSFTGGIFGGYTANAILNGSGIFFAGVYGGYTRTSFPFTGSYTGTGAAFYGYPVYYTLTGPNAYVGTYNSNVYTSIFFTRVFGYTRVFTDIDGASYSKVYTGNEGIIAAISLDAHGATAYAQTYADSPGSFVRSSWTSGAVYTVSYGEIRTVQYAAAPLYTASYGGIVNGPVTTAFYTTNVLRYTNDSYIYFANPASPSYSTLLVYGRYAYTLSDGTYVVFVGNYTNRVSFAPATVSFTKTQIQFTRNYTPTDFDKLAATGAISIYTSFKNDGSVGQYNRFFSSSFVNTYTRNYTRTYTRVYTSSYTTLLYYTQNYTNSFTRAYTTQYTGAFTSPTVQAPTVYTHPDTVAYTRTVVPYTNAGVVFTDGSGSIYTTSIVYTEGNIAYTGSSGTYIGPAIYTAAVSGYTGGSATYIWTLWVRTA